MSNRVKLHLFGKPLLLLLLSFLLFILVTHRTNSTLSLRMLSSSIYLSVSLLGFLWLIFSSYLYASYQQQKSKGCKHCGGMVGVISNRCLECGKHQWY
jgi:hypothetical protein